MQSNKSSFDNDGQRKKMNSMENHCWIFILVYMTSSLWLFSALKFKQWTKGCQGSVNYDNSS